MAGPTVKGGDGKGYPASAFLYVPDRSKPSTWKIRYKQWVGGDLKVTASILGAAWAAVGKGFRGKRVALPPAVIARIKSRLVSLYKSIGASPPGMAKSKEQADEPDTADVITEAKLEDLFEGPMFGSPDQKAIWDETTGTFKSLAMLGPKSKNGRRYRPEVMIDAVKRGIYEGLPCYIDHSKDGRKVRELAGKWVNARYCRDTGRVRGDLKTLEQHRAVMLDVFNNAPDLAAPSHVVQGKTKKVKDGDMEVEDVQEIVKGYSVDFVAGAATVSSFKEGED